MNETLNNEEQPKKRLKAFLLGIQCAICGEVKFVDKLSFLQLMSINPHIMYICSDECAEDHYKRITPCYDLVKDLMDMEGNTINGSLEKVLDTAEEAHVEIAT